MILFDFMVLSILSVFMLVTLARHIWNAKDGQVNIRQIVVPAILLFASVLAEVGLYLIGRTQ